MYIVIELQTTDGDATANVVTAHETWEAAQSKYHSVLAAAAVSDVAVHSAALLREDGYELEYMTYRHSAGEAD